MIESVPGLAKYAIAPLIKPILEISLKGLKTVTPEFVDIFSSRISDFINTQIEKHKHLNTIVFNNQKLLEELYVPLTLVKDIEDIHRKDKTEVKITKFDMNFLPLYKRVLITDTAGMGKSTLLKFLFLECAKVEYAVPIFIELRTLSGDRNILDIVEKQINQNLSSNNNSEQTPYFSLKYLQKILKQGGFIFFLDGYDEIPFKEREIVTRGLKDFICTYSKNDYVVSSRPETGLSAFPEFVQFSIRPLKKDESYTLISKYDQNSERSQQLISRLKQGEYKGVDEFLKNPLLTTLLYRCYEYKQNLPLKKHVFYRQVYDALFDWHDSTKDGYNTRQKKSKLDIDSFHKVLKVLGFITTIKGEVEGDTDTLLSWIQQAKSAHPELSFNTSDFLDDLIRAVPLFVKDGNQYRWSHKSLAEYFAAQYLCNEGKFLQEKIFTEIYEAKLLDRFENILDQIYDIDNSAFRKYFISPIAKDFQHFWANNYKNLDPKIPNELISMRKLSAFMCEIYIAKVKTLASEDIRVPPLPALEKNSSQMSWSALRRMRLFLDDNGKSQIACIKLPHPNWVILNILIEKKDPLTLRRSKIDLNKFKKVITHLPRSGWATLDDNPSSPLNSTKNFGPVTKLIAEDEYFFDSEKLMNFQLVNTGEEKITSMANQLLEAMKANTISQ